MWRSKPLDAFQSREGFFMFRVNGHTAFGRWYRILVILLNMTFGFLSGLQPLLTPGSKGALAQTAMVLSLQLGMALACFRFLPDADRIISRFAATQFLFEGLSTAALLSASIGNPPDEEALAAMVPAAPNDTTASSTTSEMVNSATSPVASADEVEQWLSLRDTGFVLSLLAMACPMLQLLEQVPYRHRRSNSSRWLIDVLDSCCFQDHAQALIEAQRARLEPS